MLAAEQGVRPDRCVTVYNGVKTEDFRITADKAGLKRSFGITDDKSLVIGMTAAIRPVKGITHFIEAFSRIGARDAGIYGLIVGACEQGEGYRNMLAELAAGLGVEKNIIFLGHRSDISQILSATDICVNSSLSEGLSNSVLEYMAAGKPVVATDVGGNSELVVHGKTGLLVRPGDADALARALAWFIARPQARLAFGEKGRERVAKDFCEARMIAKIDQIVSDCLANKRALR